MSRHQLLATLAVVAVVLLATNIARAQYRPVPVPVPVAVPVPFAEPYGGYLHGAADVIRAQAEYMESYQRAKQARQARRLEMVAVRTTAANAEQVRVADALRRDRERLLVGSATPAEVRSGRAINLLVDALANRSPGEARPAMALDNASVCGLNVSSSDGAAAGPQLVWPGRLGSAKDVAPVRQRVDSLLAKADRQATAGPVDADILSELRERADELDRLIAGHAKQGAVDEFGFTEHSQSKAFVRRLRDTEKAFGQADAGRALRTPLTAQTPTALVDELRQRGLHVGPASPEQEAAYQRVYISLARHYRQAGE